VVSVNPTVEENTEKIGRARGDNERIVYVEKSCSII
jgi:hypothetical protein